MMLNEPNDHLRHLAILQSIPSAPPWNNERTARLVKLWAEGQSASQIAADLGGITRNAVIGKVHRMHLETRDKDVVVGREHKPRAPRSTHPQPRRSLAGGGPPVLSAISFVARKVINIAPPSPEFKCDIMGLNAKNCHFPNGEPGTGDFHYCGAPQEFGSYCGFHAVVCFQDVTPQRLARLRA